MIRLRTALQRRRSNGQPDRGSAMISALIFMILLASLSLILASVLMAQVVPAQLASKSTRTVYAAESGIQAALGILRSASGSPDFSGSVFGDRTKLPCTKSGTVDGDSTAARYDLTISYYLVDPASQTDAWKASNKMACVAGSGVSVQPKFALIVAQGLDSAVAGQSASFGNRSLSAVYQFQLTNVNISGGPILAYGTKVCLQAEGYTAGSLIRYQAPAACTNPDTQNWVYDTSYQIKLARTLVPGQGPPMCISGPVTDGGNEKATLQLCLGTSDAGRWNQLWSYEGGEHWRGENKAITDYSSICLYSGATSGSPDGGTSVPAGSPKGTAAVPTYLWTGPQCAGTAGWGSFTPSPAVGAGPAGYATNQIVNYREFGRCLDVTDESITSSFMIAYPCKQDPSNTGKLKWNHKWYYTEPPAGVDRLANQQIVVKVNNSDASKYCFETPSAASGSIFPVFKTCSATNTLQNWTRVQKSTSYAGSYLFIDSLGRCLAVNPLDIYKGVSKIIVTTCTDGTDQKWNAPADTTSSSFGGFRELGG